MEKKINIKMLGIDFAVTVKLDKDNEIEKVIRVQAWDDDNDKYIKIPCDLDSFKEEVGILLRGKIKGVII